MVAIVMTPEIMDEERRNFGLLVRAIRTRMKSLSVAELADRAQTNKAAITSVESGNAACDYETIVRICNELGIDEEKAIIYRPDIIF
jgi:transcriptional regulator with XRE-family HTH domain